MKIYIPAVALAAAACIAPNCMRAGTKWKPPTTSRTIPTIENTTPTIATILIARTIHASDSAAIFAILLWNFKIAQLLQLVLVQITKELELLKVRFSWIMIIVCSKKRCFGSSSRKLFTFCSSLLIKQVITIWA